MSVRSTATLALATSLLLALASPPPAVAAGTHLIETVLTASAEIPSVPGRPANAASRIPRRVIWVGSAEGQRARPEDGEPHADARARNEEPPPGTALPWVIAGATLGAIVAIAGLVLALGLIRRGARQ
jgi:hypothetical protein